MIRMPTTVWLRGMLLLFILFLLSQSTIIYLPVILSVILAFILNPVVTFLCGIPLYPGRWRLTRGPAILLSYLIFAGTLTLLLAFIFVPFINEMNRFLANLPALVEQIKKLALLVASHANSTSIPQNFQSLMDQSLSGAATYTLNVAKRLVNGVISFAAGIIELIVVPVLTFYFLKDWKHLREDFVYLMPTHLRGKTQTVISEMATVVSGYIRGQITVSIIVGLLVFAGLYFFRIDYPMVLALLAALTEMIPIVGPFIGAAPAVLLAYLISPVMALKIALFYIVVQQLENHIIVPKVMGQSIDLHPIIIIISLLIGGQLFGIWGMMAAVPAAALFKVLAKHIWHYGEG